MLKPLSLIFTLLAAGLIGCGSDSDKKSSSSSPASSSSSSSSSESVSSSGTGALPVLETISLNYIGRYSSGVFGASAAEIPAFDPGSKRAFVVNAQQGVVDVLDMSAPDKPVKIGILDANAIAAGAVVNSVTIYNGIIALAIEAAAKTDNGFVGFYKTDDLGLLSYVSVGALPDMLTFAPNGKTVLVANEGEPSDDYSIDPEGSISVIDVTDLQNPVVRTAHFRAYNGKEAQLRAQGVRIFGPGASAAQDFEPEYIAVSADSSTAWAVLQENNALAKIDIAAASVTDILPLGFKDHSLEGNGLDVSDTDGNIDIKTWGGLRGLYLPDAVAAFEVGGSTYLITANEGDARAWGEGSDDYWAGAASKGFVEEFRVKHLVHKGGFDRRAGEDLPPQLRALGAGGLLNPEVFGYCGAVAGDPEDCREDDLLGRLTVTWTLGYRTDENGLPIMFNADGVADTGGDRLMYDALYAFGGRSVSIWTENGELVWDAGDHMERYFASEDCFLGADRDIPCAVYFNSNHEEGGAPDNRSDNKGPEPEGLTIGKLGDHTFAFIGLERIGGIMVYNISNPAAPQFVDYLNTREDWITADPGSVLSAAGDLGPEGLVFISAQDSPDGTPLLIVGNEVSGTTSIYEIKEIFAAQD